MPIQRPRPGHRSLLPCREGILAVTGSMILLAGIAVPAHAFSFGLQPGAAPSWGWQPGYVRPAKPSRASTAPREKSGKEAAKEEERPESVAAKAKGVLSIFISLDRQRLVGNIPCPRSEMACTYVSVHLRANKRS